MNTETAQRHLLEALADLHRMNIHDAPDPLFSLCEGIQFAAEAYEHEAPPIARIYACLGSLALAVREDLNEKENTHD